jgi:predicted nicotinamide N-methyase
VIADPRAFILEHTRLQRVPLVPELQLYLADEVLPIWRRVQEAMDGAEIDPPFWAFAWVGGQAIARYLLDHPAEVAGKRVLDLATGSGLCGIAATRAGAASVVAVDIDPFCEEAVALNAEANAVTVAFRLGDMLDQEPPDVDVVLGGDVCYEQPMAGRLMEWLRAANAQDVRVLIGDPGREQFPRDELIQLAEYEAPATKELEDRDVKRTGVFAFRAEYPGSI